ncbi:MAG: PDDEXK nuclease domain-containing protein [Methanimicrococcus sp.]|nr:PDDEXK nuclease domain-containing protein [Methanimicrococcus sp.]
MAKERAAYGKQIVVTLARQLEEQYGNSFEAQNLRRMIQFAKRFPDFEIVVPLARQLSWSHFLILIPITSDEALMYYANDAMTRQLGRRELRRQVMRRTYERAEIADAQLTKQSTIPQNVFKDPYLLDVLGLKDNFQEADLEKAILLELESFLLEFGHGFSFVCRQKRMIWDSDDYTLDLLFYHRIMKRLVAVELKLEKFRPAFKAQMEFYLKWLNRYERQPDENEPVGLILCPHANRGTLELLEMDKAGIAVAEFWTTMPPKEEFERKINTIMLEAKERIEQRKSFPVSDIRKQIDFYYEQKADDDE